MDLSPLRHLVRSHPVIDNHAHNLLTASATRNYARYPLEQITSEAQGAALANAPASLPLLRAAGELRWLYGSASDDWLAVKAAREDWVRRDYDGLVRRCLEGTHVLLLDDLLTEDDIESYVWHDRFTTGSTRRIVRIETLATRSLRRLRESGSNPRRFSETSSSSSTSLSWTEFRDDWERQIRMAIADPAVVGFKSVVCYRTGLNVNPYDEDEDVLQASFMRCLNHPEARVEDKPLNDWLVRQTLILLAASPDVRKPLQLHTGLGDSDIDLVLSNPAYLQPLVARFPSVDIVLLHSAYPYTRQAGYLACVYDNVYLDLGEVFPMVSRDGQKKILREALEIVPTTRLLWSTDGHFHPETFWLANRQFRQSLETVLVDYVQLGDLSMQQACVATVDILFQNSNRIYNLNEVPILSKSTSLSPPLSSPSNTLDTFLNAHPQIKYIWMQFYDYTATPRVRIFPVREFRRIARRDRRVGICLAIQWMLQTDSVAPQGSVTGQFYLHPDLTTLRPNAGLTSPSASVMTFWRTEEDTILPGCPRSLLQSMTERFLSKDITVTCGFEIEVVFLRLSDNTQRDTQRDTKEYIPSATTHSWSQMTPHSRLLLPMLEEITETLETINIHIQQFHAESAPGQFEFILPPSTPLDAIDSLLTARQVIVSVAEKHNLRATLHPRPFPSAAGTAAHAHVSITPSAKTTEESFLAGLMTHYPSVMAFTLSNEESYSRVESGLWAGSEWVAWGTQNRETPVRKIAKGHWEIKSLDGLANMYLAMAAVLAAGWVGVSRGLELGVRDCLYKLMLSLDALENDSVLQDVLGPDLVKNYIIVKRFEREMLLAMDEEKRRQWLIERY
ncbi:extracellular developmental signal biosynthesis protein FluG [Aspergillus tanneri]|uniref:Uncharacterized protein n=1 Tax=Aspergillus tanneri TaxID=1220188 RepID=A0A5M9MFP5_9EURO|nr:uncharacterized protein ATNIH1004_007215 [Aspergillus tanneri]KAA8645795.1 hypothetical protein ATNIH1004_007215 [Aspergillus tanneri]